MVNRDEDRGEGQQILVCFTTFLDVQTLKYLRIVEQCESTGFTVYDGRFLRAKRHP